jgi:hypothetical protein
MELASSVDPAVADGEVLVLSVIYLVNKEDRLSCYGVSDFLFLC